MFLRTLPEGLIWALSSASLTLISESVWLVSVSSIWFMFRLNLEGSKSKLGMKPPRVQ